MEETLLEPELKKTLLTIARESIRHTLEEKVFDLKKFKEVETPSKGVFVSIWLPDRQLRGCMGQIQPEEGLLIKEVSRLAVAAATKDSRFTPMTMREMDQVKIEIQLLAEPREVSEEEEWNPQEQGILVSSGWRQAILLPGNQEIGTSAEQIALAYEKAGLDPTESALIQKFETITFSE